MPARKVSASLTSAGSTALDTLLARWGLSTSATIDRALQIAAAPAPVPPPPSPPPAPVPAPAPVPPPAPAPAPVPPPPPAPAPAGTSASVTFTNEPITLGAAEITKDV